MHRLRSLLGLAALLLLPAAALAGSGPAPTLCAATGPCAHPLPVKIVIVTMFEVGADSGDAPGEFQLWKERRHLDMHIPFPQSYHDLSYNPDSQILGMVTGVGSIRASAATMALGLDPRFDLSHAYWLIAGIAGIDPNDASIGSAAWARYIVDGDLAHEIDAREIPKNWKFGRFPIDSAGEQDNSARRVRGELFTLNPALEQWAFALTRDLKLPDDPGIQASRARYAGYPSALKPPFVLEGDQLSAITFWHGKLLNDWANAWVKRWTGGKGEFVTSAEEDSGTAQALDYLDRAGRAHKDRLLLLRAGSNYTMPPPGVTPADNLAHENMGYSGMRASLENLYIVGSTVIDELLAHWDRYRDTPPQ